MYCTALSRSNIGKRFQCSYLAAIWLMVVLSILGCAHSSQVAENDEVASHMNTRPIDLDDSTSEKIGHEALQKIGYEEIIGLAEKAGFVEYKSDERIQLASYGSIVASASVRVFSRYAAAAAVTSQADSPLPGPADIAAVGILVLGLVDAGLLDGHLLNTIGGSKAGTQTELPCPRNETFSADRTDNAAGCTDLFGNVRCFSRRHYPCAGVHTHGKLSYQVVRNNNCIQVTRKAIRCDGPFSVTSQCGSISTVDCSQAGSETAGIFEE